jgi:hypothetical protein
VGKRTGALLCIYIPVNVYITMEHHHFLWVIQRTKWQFSIAMLVDQRVFVVVFNFLKSLASTCMYLYIYACFTRTRLEWVGVKYPWSLRGIHWHIMFTREICVKFGAWIWNSWPQASIGSHFQADYVHRCRDSYNQIGQEFNFGGKTSYLIK